MKRTIKVDAKEIVALVSELQGRHPARQEYHTGEEKYSSKSLAEIITDAWVKAFVPQAIHDSAREARRK